MLYNTLGNTGLEVSAVSFGTAPLGDMFGAADETAAIGTVHHAVDTGINFFDSSPYYGGGLAEERLGKAVTTAGLRIDLPAPKSILDAARAVADLCADRGVNVSYLANQFSIQRSGCATTVIGTTKVENLDAAVDAVSSAIDEELLADVLALTAGVRETSWISGKPQNN